MKFKKFLILIIINLYINYVQADEDSLRRDFSGINFGVGISVTHDLGTSDRIKSALLDENGIVRITKDQNDVARMMLETHYFFEPNLNDKSFLGMTPGEKWGHGPFIALQPGTDDIIEAIGLGWMVGFRRPGQGSESWNLGIGYIIDPSVQILGDGIKVNQALPAGETQIRYKETSQSGIFLLASFTF